MATEAEEVQTKEFLKRAEIRTMKKDLRALREVDALKERDKITKIRTLEEQLATSAEAMAAKEEKEKQEKGKLEEVLQKNEGEERIAEKDLKNYATEEERQQIFLLESQRLASEKQIDAIDQEKDPALKLEKNKLLLEKRDRQAQLDSILEQEKKLEDEEKFIAEKEQSTTIASQKKSLEQSRWDLDKKIQDIEKKRWEAEKQVQETDAKAAEIDKSSEQLVIEKNSLNDKILGIDKSLREIYSAVMVREEERRRSGTQEEIMRRETLSKARTEEKEKVQRQQWSRSAPLAPNNVAQIPIPVKRLSKQSFESEEEQRKKFLERVEQASQIPGAQQQKSNIQ